MCNSSDLLTRLCFIQVLSSGDTVASLHISYNTESYFAKLLIFSMSLRKNFDYDCFFLILKLFEILELFFELLHKIS